MKLKEIIKLINGKVLTRRANLNREAKGCCSADLMSDVLASAQADALLLTGLCNPQVVRTAHIADVTAIIFIHGKLPAPETIELADQEGIPLIAAPFSMYELCGRLYRAGLPSLEKLFPT